MKHEMRSKRSVGMAWCMTILTMAALMLAISPIPACAAEVVITVRGTVAPESSDTLGVFGAGTDLKGQPFTLTATFDDATSTERVTNDCPVSEISGTSANPARVVLKIGNGSYVFGTKPESKWDAYKSTIPNCNGVGIGFHVKEGAMPQTSNLWVTLQPPPGGRHPFSGSVNWQVPISSPAVDGGPDLGRFTITRPGDGQHAAWGRLMARSMSVGPANGQAGEQTGDATTDSDSTSVARQETENPAATDGSSTSQAPAKPQSLKDWLHKAIGGRLPKIAIPNP
jgi:hypothetical protein